MWRRPLTRLAGQLYCGASTTAVRSPAACLPALGLPTRTCQSTLNINEQSLAVLGTRQVRYSHMSSLVDRGAYDERIYQHEKGSDVKSLDLVSDGRLLSITWGDGKVSRFHSVWLRHSCFCPDCRMDTGQIQVEFDKVTEQSRVLSATNDGEGCLTVRWKEDPGHLGIFPLKFLKARCYSKESLENARNSRRMTFSKDNVIPRVQYNEVISSSQGVYQWVKALNEPGIALMEGVPCEPGMVKKVCQRIADLPQHSIYGETFDVKAQTRPINAAYSATELKLHMDLPMYESPPGIQALHCLEFDDNVTGGDNFFVDLFHVAETFREQYPEDFDLLCKVPLTFEDIQYNRDWPIHMHYKRPIFTMNKYGELTGVAWHPSLMGPLQVEEELVEPLCQAIGRMYALVNNFPYCFQHRFRKGELIAFNNRRVLHGRAAYSNQAGERFLQGCYVEISEFKSCIQVLSNLVGDGRPAIRVGDYGSY